MSGRVCFNWTAPAIWPHAVLDIRVISATDNKEAVTCSSCLWRWAARSRPLPVHRHNPNNVPTLYTASELGPHRLHDRLTEEE